jgi:hypothetical protein
MIANLRRALFVRLDTRPNALGLTPVYDYIPDANAKAPPYVSIGDLDSEKDDTDTSDGAVAICAIHLFSDYAGAQELAGLMDAVRSLLHNEPLTVTGATVILVTAESGEIQIGADGVTREGIVRVRVLIDDIT